jgi:hypothetical protein
MKFLKSIGISSKKSQKWIGFLESLSWKHQYKIIHIRGAAIEVALSEK